MPKPVSESFTAAYKAMARRVLDDAPKGLRASDRRRLEYGLEQNDPDYSAYMEFERAGSNCTLNLAWDSSARGFRDELPRDADGSEYCPVVLKASVNWPCHGSTDAATCLARLELYRQVALFAAELGAEFDRTYHRLSRTAAQRDEQEASAAAARIASAVRVVVDGNKKGLKVNGLVGVPIAECSPIPDGEYIHADGTTGRSYKLAVRRTGGEERVAAAMLGRVA
jgi:hypothetical protein